MTAAVLLWLGVIALCLTLSVLCWRKGKRKTAVVGVLAFHPALIVGAVRLAKPDSTVGLGYNQARYERSCKRLPKHVEYARNARPLYLPDPA